MHLDELQYAKYISADECMVTLTSSACAGRELNHGRSQICKDDQVLITRSPEHRLALCQDCGVGW